MYGQNHRYCQNCGHAIRSGRQGCGTCGALAADMMLLDVAMDRGFAGSGIGFDPLDGQVAIDIPGTDFAFEPGTGQMDVDLGGFDFPI